MSEPYVWHIVMTRAGQPVERGERIATVSLPPEAVAKLGDGDLDTGLARMRKALDAERAIWAKRVIAAGYVDGFGVSIHAERGYRRSIFPGVHVAGIATTPPAVLPGSAIFAGGPIRRPS